MGNRPRVVSHPCFDKWMRFFGWHGEWMAKPKGAIRKQFEDVAAAGSIGGVVWHEARDRYRPEWSEFLWKQLETLRDRNK